MLEKQCYAMVALELVGFEWPIFATDKQGIIYYALVLFLNNPSVPTQQSPL